MEKNDYLFYAYDNYNCKAVGVQYLCDNYDTIMYPYMNDLHSFCFHKCTSNWEYYYDNDIHC
jgi:hypothetical protein